MLLLWNIIISLLWPLLCFYAPFRGTIMQRLGRFEQGCYDPASSGLRVLINAVSAGEVVAISSFVHELKRMRPGMQVALLTTTQSGQEMARRKLGDAIDLLAYFPLVDLPFVVRRYLNRLRPHIYITTEAEVWPNIQAACRQRDIPVALINARLYLHNKRGVRGWIVRRLYDLCDLIVCQDDRQRENFLTFGVPAGRLTVSGNTKFDFDLPRWDDDFLTGVQRKYGVQDVPVVVAGSTHPGEDEVMLDALDHIRKQQKAARMVIAPRHIERADDVVALAKARSFTALKLAEHEPGKAWDVLVVDRYGVLTDFYRLATVVIMGGTFHPKVGGHNILEATILGKPVITGPHVFSITAQLDMLVNVKGIVQVESSGALSKAAAGMLGVPEQTALMGLVAREATLANRGASARAAEMALVLVGGKTGVD